MADPLSLAASVAGLVSLGIQVTQGVNTYLDALKGRREDLDAVHRKNDTLRQIIDFVKSTVSSPQPLNRSHAAVADCIVTCEGELAGLETLIAQLAGCKNAQSWKEKLQDRSRKLSYPFKQSKVQQLSQRLDQANGTLQIALEGLGLHIAQRSEQTLEGVASSIHGFSAEFHNFRSDVASIRQCSQESNILQRDHYDRVENHWAMHTTSLSTIVSITQNHNTALISQNSELIAEIGNLRKLIAAKEQGSTSQAQSRVTPAQAVLRVARSPPSQLKKLCDDLGGRDSISLASRETDNFVCLCTSASPRAKRGSTHWGFFQLYHERSRSAHQSHCPWVKKTEKFGLGFLGLTKVLQVAIDVSFTLSSGAGGWSLSQNFTYHPTVDRETDPVFQALANFIRSQRRGDRFLSEAEAYKRDHEKAVELLQEIKQIYAEGRSTPNAVDSGNGTLLHHFFLRYSHIAFRVWSWERIYKTLRSLGVPTTSYDLAGQTWLSRLPYAARHMSLSSTLAVSTIIQSEFVGIPVNPTATSAVTVSLLKLLEVSPILAEVYDCGPMSLAVLANDPEQVECLLASHPNSVLEQNSAGQTPLHLAANKLSCLQLLVGASPHWLLNQRDGGGTTALEYAMRMSSQRCVKGSLWQKCSRCCCAECVAILLNADCEVPFDSEAHFRSFELASERAKRRFVSHLRNRRQRLLQLAQFNRWFIRKGDFSFEADELPDVNAPLIVNLLRANNIIIPPALDVSAPIGLFKSVFQLLSDAHNANLFFRRGFKNVDLLVNGRTPLSTINGDVYDYNAEYYQWLIDNGADVFRLLIPSRQTRYSTDIRGTFAAHSVLYKTGEMLPFLTSILSNYDDGINNVSSLISRILPSGVRDGCICACLDDGCTPLVYLLKATRHSNETMHQQRPDIIEDSAELILQYFEPLENALNIQLQLSSLRWITFEALGLTHTCCNPEKVLRSVDSESPHRGIEADDLCLEGEDPEVLERFEKMVEELSDAAQGTFAATSSLVDFWTNVWASRVRKEMEKLRGNNLNEKERQDSEAMGIRWHHQPQPEEQSIDDFTVNPYQWGTWESVEWRARQLNPSWYGFDKPMEPRVSAFQSVREEPSEGSS